MKMYKIFFILLIITCTSPEKDVNFIHIPGEFLNNDEFVLFDGIDRLRTKTLLLDANFNEAALRRVEDIRIDIEKGLPISHSGYGKAYVFLDSLGIRRIGENLAYNYTRSESVIIGWIASEEHLKNLSAKKWKYVGIAIGEDSEENKIYCAIFGY